MSVGNVRMCLTTQADIVDEIRPLVMKRRTRKGSRASLSPLNRAPLCAGIPFKPTGVACQRTGGGPAATEAGMKGKTGDQVARDGGGPLSRLLSHVRTDELTPTHPHTHTRRHTQTPTHTHTRRHTDTHTRIQAHTHTRRHTYTHTRRHTDTHTSTHAYTQTHIHADTHTRRHTYTQT